LDELQGRGGHLKLLPGGNDFSEEAFLEAFDLDDALILD